MVTTIVQFQLAETLAPDAVRKMFAESGARYQAVPGLVRKYYLLAEDGRAAGGVYLWESRADAERLFTEDWREMLARKYGSPPVVTWFETPVIVDNRTGEVTRS